MSTPIQTCRDIDHCEKCGKWEARGGPGIPREVHGALSTDHGVLCQDPRSIRTGGQGDPGRLTEWVEFTGTEKGKSHVET